jgi:hypothetical protein
MYLQEVQYRNIAKCYDVENTIFMNGQQNYVISQDSDNLLRLLNKTESVEIWRQNYYVTSLLRLLLGSLGGLILLIMISIHKNQPEDTLCELKKLYKNY